MTFFSIHVYSWESPEKKLSKKSTYLFLRGSWKKYRNKIYVLPGPGKNYFSLGPENNPPKMHTCFSRGRRGTIIFHGVVEKCIKKPK